MRELRKVWAARHAKNRYKNSLFLFVVCPVVSLDGDGVGVLRAGGPREDEPHRSARALQPSAVLGKRKNMYFA